MLPLVDLEADLPDVIYPLPATRDTVPSDFHMPAHSLFHSPAHAFIQHIFIEHLLDPWYCCRQGRYNIDPNRCEHVETHILVGQTINEKMRKIYNTAEDDECYGGKKCYGKSARAGKGTKERQSWLQSSIGRRDSLTHRSVKI